MTARTPTRRSVKNAQVAANIQARYDAAGTGKRMAGWNPPASGPNRAIEGLQKIRNRARDAARNDWSGESALQKWSTNLIGIGIRPRISAKRLPSTERRQELNDLWEDFVQTCDADGVLTFYGMQTLGVRSWMDSGEVFVRKRVRRAPTTLPLPLQVQLIEADFVPMLDADTYQGLPTGHIIRSGVELDRNRQRVAYWCYREHPGDKSQAGGYIDPSKLLRIPASEMLHMFEPKRPGQLRGVSMLAPVLAKLREIGNYDDAVLLRQQIANLFVAFLTRKLGNEDDNTDPLTGAAIGGSFDKPLMPLAPGLIQELDDGQDVKFANPPEAGTTYSDYMRTQNMTLGAGSGLPYELFSGDIKEVSDRTLRVIINEFRRFAEQRQWQIVIPMFCQPIRRWFAESAVVNGKAALSEADALVRVEWAPHGWAYIHPVQDPQGKKLEMEAGIRSRSGVIGERGDDPEAVDEERAADDAREQQLKIGPYSKSSQSAKKPAGKSKPGDEGDGDGIDDDEYSAPPNAS